MANENELPGVGGGQQQQPQQMMISSSNQERYLPLSFILENAIQRTYHELMLMAEMFQSKSDRDRKIKLLEYAYKTRQLFIRIYALVKFIRTAHINVSVIKIKIKQFLYLISLFKRYNDDYLLIV
jgi:hypothetical protein